MNPIIIVFGFLLVSIMNTGFGQETIISRESASNLTQTGTAYLERLLARRPSAFNNRPPGANNKSYIAPIYKSQQNLAEQAVAATLPIYYSIGRQVLTGAMKVHIVYYGSWTSTQKSIVETFISNVGSTKWFNIGKTYYYQATSKSPKTYIAGPITLGTRITNNYSLGDFLYDIDVQNLLAAYIANKQLPNDPTAAYLFLTSADVYETMDGYSYFCYDYCGYHSSFVTQNKRYFYAITGNEGNCIDTCATTNYYASPNGDVGVDGMMSAVGHELLELMSDPIANINNLRAWEDSSGYENSDKCAYTYGPVSKASNGAYYNLIAGTKKYLIQQIWNAKLQTCALSA